MIPEKNLLQAMLFQLLLLFLLLFQLLLLLLLHLLLQSLLSLLCSPRPDVGRGLHGGLPPGPPSVPDDLRLHRRPQPDLVPLDDRHVHRLRAHAPADVLRGRRGRGREGGRVGDLGGGGLEAGEDAEHQAVDGVRERGVGVAKLADDLTLEWKRDEIELSLMEQF